MRPVLIALMFLFPLFQADVASAQGNAEAGKKLWADLACRNCHGDDGQGGFGPDLAGRRLTFDQFRRAIRTPWGIMPAYPETQNSDQELADLHAYLSNLPPVAQPAAWRTPLPANAPKGQEVMIATFGCGQCHGATMAQPRATAGGIAADFDWFKRMSYEHTTAMPEYRKMMGNPNPNARLRMGNFLTSRAPDALLEEAWRWMRDDLKFRPLMTAQLTSAGSGGTYNLVVQNNGLPEKGLVPEDITILVALKPGSKVTNATGAGYQGVRNDPQLKADAAVWQLPRLAPKENQKYTLTVEGGGVASGVVRWARPMVGTGTGDQINIVIQPPAQTN